MGYIGRGLNQTGGQYRKLDNISSSFNGSTTSFNLTIDGLEVTPTAQNLPGISIFISLFKNLLTINFF